MRRARPGRKPRAPIELIRNLAAPSSVAQQMLSALGDPCPETVVIGRLAFQIPAGIHPVARRAMLDAAEQHVLERGEISVADAQRLLRDRDERTADDLPGPRGTKYSRRERDMSRMLWTKHQPCCLEYIRLGLEMGLGAGPARDGDWLGPIPDLCRGAIEAHHAGQRGVGQKAPDDTVLPLCQHHHTSITDRAGVFASWPRGAVKRWELAMVEVYQERYSRWQASDVV